MNRSLKDCAATAAIVLAGLSVQAVAAWASDPVPGVDVKLGKNHFEAQSSGDESPPSVAFEQTNDVQIDAAMKKETGRLRIDAGQIEVLSTSALSGEITGNWTGDEAWESDGASMPRETNITTGDIDGTFAAPGVTNVQQNTGVLSLQQGAVSMAVKLPGLP